MVPPTQLSKTIEVELSKYRKSSIGVSELSGHYRTSIGKVLSNYRTGAQTVFGKGGEVAPGHQFLKSVSSPVPNSQPVSKTTQETQPIPSTEFLKAGF